MNIISDLMRRVDPSSVDTAETALQKIDAIELLESCLDPRNREVMHAIAADSNTHANGFHRISFPSDSPSPVRIRLHTWPTGESKKDWRAVADAHNHKWPFASRILIGGLVHDIYAIELGRGDYQHFQHVSLGERYKLTHAGPAVLERVNVQVIDGGTIYRMLPETVHRVSPKNHQYSVTLVAELAPTREFTDVFADPNKHMDGAIKPAPLEVAELRSEFRRIIEVLRGVDTKAQ